MYMYIILCEYKYISMNLFIPVNTYIFIRIYICMHRHRNQGGIHLLLLLLGCWHHDVVNRYRAPTVVPYKIIIPLCWKYRVLLEIAHQSMREILDT